MNCLSTNIKHLRLSNKLTQDDIAKIVKKSRVLVSQWEADEREITIEDIIKLSDYFNISMDELVGVDLRFVDEKENKISQSEILFNKNKKYLTENDWNIINTIAEQRKNEKEGIE